MNIVWIVLRCRYATEALGDIILAAAEMGLQVKLEANFRLPGVRLGADCTPIHFLKKTQLA